MLLQEHRRRLVLLLLRYRWVVNAKGMDTNAAVKFVLDAFTRRDEMARDIGAGMGVVSAGLEDYTAEIAKQLTAASCRQ